MFIYLLKYMTEMIDKGETKEKEKELIQKEEFQTEQLSLKSKKRLIILVSIIMLILIVIISIILIFTRTEDNNNNETNNDEIEILPPLVQNSTSGNHTHTIIFMPGLSNPPEDFKDVFTKRINFTKKNDTTIIILRSPLSYVTVHKSNNYSWFDIYDFPLDDFSDLNLEDLKKSAKVLEKVVNNEVNLLNGNYEKIIVGGHSQGAAVSLYQAYTSQKKYGGVFAFSGFLSPGEISDDKRDMKVYFGYGDKDDVIIPSFINKTLERVMNFEGFDLHIYKDHKHYVNRNQSTDAGIFLDNLIK